VKLGTIVPIEIRW